jgi:hypothetical protein
MNKAWCSALVAALAATSAHGQMPLGLDTSYHQTTITHGGISATYPTADGSVFISGYWTYWPYIDWGRWGRLLPDGGLDPDVLDYGGDGTGKIILFEGHYYTNGGKRYDLNGVFDQAYRDRPYCPWPMPIGIGDGSGEFTIQADGRLVLVGGGNVLGPYGVNPPGYFGTYRGELDYNCTDSTFHQLGTNDIAWCIESLADGRMLVSGRFTQVNGQPTGSLVRIWPEGQWDTTFHSPITGQYGGYPQTFLVQDDGKIILGGAFMVEGTQDTVGLMRIFPDGALDTSFHYATKFRFTQEPGQFILAQAAVWDIEELEDGRLMVVGVFDNIDGLIRRKIAMFDSTGHLITDVFNGEGVGGVMPPNPGPNDRPFSGLGEISKSPDGSYFISGQFKGFDDGITSDTTQLMICKLFSEHVGVAERAPGPLALRIYPNPGTSELYVTWPGRRTFTVHLVDGAGRSTDSAISSVGSVWLDTRGLVAGCYVVEARAPDGTRIRTKWIKR